MREETVDECHLVEDKKTKSETYESRDESQTTIETSKAVLGKRKRDSDRCGDQHHARDRAKAEDQQIYDCPGRNTDRCEHQQGDGCRTGESVNHAHGQRPDNLVEPHPAKDAIHPADWGRMLWMSVFFGTVAMGMAVDVVTVSMGMRVEPVSRGCERFSNPAHHSRKIQNSQKNQHQPNREFHGETNSCWNRDAKQYDRGADNENGDGVTEPPQDTNQCGMANTSLAAHNRGYSNDMVRIGGVAHAKKEAKGNDGEQSDHLLLARRVGAERRANVLDRSRPSLMPNEDDTAQSCAARSWASAWRTSVRANSLFA